MHGVVGSPWGNPSYIQPTYFEPGQFGPLAGELKKALSLPVVHTGRITDPDVAERVLAAGEADIVGMARAHIADGDLLAKARAGRTADIRPCVGGNECISRRYVEGLPFGCAVNPTTSHEVDVPWPAVSNGRRLLVVGGGPAGMELAALARESGLDVDLWEADAELGGQLRYAVRAPRHEGYAAYLRLAGAAPGRPRRRRSTGASAPPRTTSSPTARTPSPSPPAPGRADRTSPAPTPRTCSTSATSSPAGSTPGHRVLVVAQDDHVAPLSVADFLAERGHAVSVVYATQQPAPLMGRYIIGAILGRLDANDVRLSFMEEVVAHRGPHRRRPATSTRCAPARSASSTRWCSPAAASPSPPSTTSCAPGSPDVHILGDAYAPRRLVFATRQAYALAEQLVTTAAR